MTISDEEDENLAYFLESEVLSEISDQVFTLLLNYFNIFEVIHNTMMLGDRLGF